MAEEEVKSFENVDKHLVELKGLVMKIGFVSTSLITLELLSEKLNMLESTIHKELIPLLKLINLMPTDAPRVHTGLQGGEKGGVGSGAKVGTGGSGSGENDDDGKVVGKVLPTPIPSSLPKHSTVTSSTITTTRPITNGIVIGYDGGETRSSEPKPT